jgi:hypothetical protein
LFQHFYFKHNWCCFWLLLLQVTVAEGIFQEWECP